MLNINLVLIEDFTEKIKYFYFMNILNENNLNLILNYF
jgi:hypothetical protein